MSKLIAKPFYEGAPLDPNKLNDILTDISTTYGETALANKTINGFTESLYIVYDCGRVSIPQITKANEPKYSSQITFENSSFDTSIVATSPIIISATVSTDFTPKVAVNALVKYSNGKQNFQVGAVASGPMSETVTIDWISIQKIPKKA